MEPAARNRQQRTRHFMKRAIPTAIAAAVLIIASMHIYYANLSPSPYDLRVLGQSELLAGTQGSIRVRTLWAPPR